MAYTFAYGGDPNNNNYRTWYSNNYLYSPYGGFPTGNPSSDGGRPVKIYSIGTDWSIGATYHRIAYGASVLAPGSVINGVGGTFHHRVGHGSGELGAGRNTGNGSTMTDSADGDTVAGGICGWFTWATVSFAPHMLDALPQAAPGSIRVRFSGDGNTGGASMEAWQLRYSEYSDMRNAVTVASSGTSDLVLKPGVQYWFQARGLNDVGWSAWSSTISGVTRAAAGKRRAATSWVTNTRAQRRAASGWVDIARKRRRTATGWVDVG